MRMGWDTYICIMLEELIKILPHLISYIRSYNIFYCLLYLMVTFLFDISLKRKLLIISSEEGTEFAEDKLSNLS